jgi:hypothetical protein
MIARAVVSLWDKKTRTLESFRFGTTEHDRSSHSLASQQDSLIARTIVSPSDSY